MESGHQVVLVTATTDVNFSICEHRRHPKVNKSVLVQLFIMFKVYFGLLPYLSTVLRFIQLEQKEEIGFRRILEKIYINATLLKLKTDWLHFGFATMAIDRELVAKAIGAKMAVSFRGYDIDVYPLRHTNCYQKLWRYTDKVHTISNYLLQKAYILGLSTNVKYQIIYPAVDFRKLNGFEKRIKNETEKLKLLSIARLHWIKGIDDLIEAAFLLKQNKIDFEWQIIGDIDVFDKERYQYHIYQKGFKNELQLLSKKKHHDTLRLLNHADIYVQTSLSEGFCNAVLEAQALGKLCVAYHSGALSENILERITGYLVQKHEPKLLTEKIIELMRLPNSDKLKISYKASQRVEKEFNLEKQKLEFLKFYN